MFDNKNSLQARRPTCLNHNPSRSFCPDLSILPPTLEQHYQKMPLPRIDLGSNIFSPFSFRFFCSQCAFPLSRRLPAEQLSVRSRPIPLAFSLSLSTLHFLPLILSLSFSPAGRRFHPRSNYLGLDNVATGQSNFVTLTLPSGAAVNSKQSAGRVPARRLRSVHLNTEKTRCHS
jgi:hypothetical protein